MVSVNGDCVGSGVIILILLLSSCESLSLPGEILLNGNENSKEIIVEFGSSHFFVNADIVRQMFDFFGLSKSNIMKQL